MGSDADAGRTQRSHRARLHAALGDPVRLAIVDELTVSDRSPSELSGQLDIRGNLLSHHLDTLVRAGIVERVASEGDRRRRYVRLVRASLAPLQLHTDPPSGRVLFVCTHNSARSQLAAVLWRHHLGGEATSAGTRPAKRVHPGAVAAAARLGLDLRSAVPRRVEVDEVADLVVTVCDLAHEALPAGPRWHWSVPDPVADATPAAFDAAATELDRRVRALA